MAKTFKDRRDYNGKIFVRNAERCKRAMATASNPSWKRLRGGLKSQKS